MVNAIQKNLKRGILLLNSIDNEQYCNTSIPPYYSSIGGHIRHILDIFSCVFDGLDKGQINLANRKRNSLVETKIELGLNYFNQTMVALDRIKDEDFDRVIAVTDDLGLGFVTINYTLGSVLIQAHSHAIHHFASIGSIISQLGIDLPDEDFGYNPTTPKKINI